MHFLVLVVTKKLTSRKSACALGEEKFIHKIFWGAKLDCLGGEVGSFGGEV